MLYKFTVIIMWNSASKCTLTCDKTCFMEFACKMCITLNICYDNNTVNEVVIIWRAICHIYVTLLYSSVLGSAAYGNKACLNFCFVILWSSTSMLNELFGLFCRGFHNLFRDRCFSDGKSCVHTAVLIKDKVSLSCHK